MQNTSEIYLLQLKTSMNAYAPLSLKTWEQIVEMATFQFLKKGDILINAGQTAKNIHFICEGILRSFITDEQGSSYSKNIFLEKSFAATKVSLLLNAPSYFTIEALEDCTLINLNFKKYKQLIAQNSDLKDFYIAYIERNWIVEKEQREISLVMENASERYQKLLNQHPSIDKRVSQQHIASHLGITPTQLSRIRKALKK
ncbi:Crp/Fnr family transcriptional regulator [Wenyingzhuangia sp. 2_MG-2023]|uniref:Crp/Fnr family transcriptional regulator n=1 Tax=Wenyingzhuangia sp. 2_MG-2023 TaxID=3062639 RepID=UPI0026E177E2|nr:Crp/Fnr family transcriptional regulator [Wenyingzhuangia sp. 2_MG-2023]MDO6739226.1 Crp/Fnr family transcriptional regulator [Wenyingzhuangia sp. 2_MG-2023]